MTLIRLPERITARWTPARAVKMEEAAMAAVMAAVAMSVAMLALVARWWRGGEMAMEEVETRMDGKVAIVTGGYSGLGCHVVKQLAARGCHVVVAGRDARQGTLVAAASRGSGHVVFMQLDLASLASVRRFVDKFLEGGSGLHVLVNNAGVMSDHNLTEDGLDVTMSTNFLGPFLLTKLLLPDLLKHASHKEPARVINLVSDSHKYVSALDLNNLHQEKFRHPHMFLQYAHSKLAAILFTRELAARARREERPLVAFGVHPGHVHTGLMRHLSGREGFWLRAKSWAWFRRAEVSVGGVLSCACEEEISVIQAYNGGYMDEDGCFRTLWGAAADDDLARALWDKAGSQLASRPLTASSASLTPLPTAAAAPTAVPAAAAGVTA